jgi:hypothetical protein
MRGPIEMHRQIQLSTRQGYMRYMCEALHSMVQRVFIWMCPGSVFVLFFKYSRLSYIKDTDRALIAMTLFIYGFND